MSAALVLYVIDHTERSICRCGQCLQDETEKKSDLSVDRPEKWNWSRHTVNMYFFDVSVKNNPDANEFIRLIKEHSGAFNEVDVFDGNEHNYMELGGWFGDQGFAMQFMALGKILGLWEIMQPGMILDVNNPEEKALADRMAGAGMVSLVPIQGNK